jgi:membrane protein implicated in regulation of membrane protease activity
MDWNWVLLLAGASLILLEVALGGFAGFDLVLIGSAFMMGGALGMWVGDARIGFLTASALCVVYVAFGRRWVRDRMKARAVPSNTDAVIGRRGIAVTRISPHDAGQVRLDGEVWRALPTTGHADIEPGTEVTIDRVDGVTVLVRK